MGIKSFQKNFRMMLDTVDINVILPAVLMMFLVSHVKGLTMVFERGQAYVIAYRRGGVGRSPFRTILVCSTRGDVVYGIPATKIAEFEAEKKVCELMGAIFYGKRPEPQTFLVSRIKAVGNKVKAYRSYMDAKVAKIVKSKLDMVENAR